MILTYTLIKMLRTSGIASVIPLILISCADIYIIIPLTTALTSPSHKSKPAVKANKANLI